MNIIKTLTKPLRRLKCYYTNVRSDGYSKWESIRITADMVYCRKRFHCLPSEYMDYAFMNKKDRERKYFLLRYHQKARFFRVKRGHIEGEDKYLQYELLGELVGREYISVDKVGLDATVDFVKKHGKVIFKPNHGSCGKGVFAFDPATDTDPQEKINEIIGDDYICEEYVTQHEKMNLLQTRSVNTIRVITLHDGKDVKIIDTAIRIGDGSSVCDNQRCGGYAAAVDKETGIIMTGAYTMDRRCYLIHPGNGTQVIGFQVPNWDAVIETAKAGARKNELRAICGWDIAVTPTGALIIEVNGGPGPALNQIADQKPKGKEIIEYIEKNKCRYRDIHPKTRRAIRKYY